MKPDTFSNPRLSRWYVSHCDGDWEHGAGVSIQSLDNPGWLIKIDLAGTNLQQRPFSPRTQGLQTLADGREHPAGESWHSIKIHGTTFVGAGDPSQLEFLLETFLEWAETGRAEK